MIVDSVELETNDETQTLRLEAINKHADGSGYGCEIHIRSGGFTCDQRFCFDDNYLTALIKGVTAMDRGAPCKAVLKHTYEDDFIQFEMNSCGHVFVNGVISEEPLQLQQLRFNIRTDQTALKPLIRELRAIFDAKPEG